MEDTLLHSTVCGWIIPDELINCSLIKPHLWHLVLDVWEDKGTTLQKHQGSVQTPNTDVKLGYKSHSNQPVVRHALSLDIAPLPTSSIFKWS